MEKLSSAQQATLNKMSKTKWLSAYEIGASLSTLYSLVKKGKAKTRGGLGMIFSPRTCILFIST